MLRAIFDKLRISVTTEERPYFVPGISHLNRLRDEQHQVRVLIDGVDAEFTGTISLINTNDQYVLLDRIDLDIPSAIQLAGREVSVTVVTGAIPTFFDTSIIDVDMGMREVRLRLPQKVSVDQRRSAYRVSLRDKLVEVRCPIAAKPVAVDLSSKGIRLEVEGHHPVKSCLSSLHLSLEKLPVMKLVVRVRNCELISSGRYAKTGIGLEFVGLSPVQEQSIERYVLLQQQQKKESELSK